MNFTTSLQIIITVSILGYQQGYLANQLSDDVIAKKATMCRDLIDVTKKIDPGNARYNLRQK